jgi:hypothetical protein
LIIQFLSQKKQQAYSEPGQVAGYDRLEKEGLSKS